MRKKRKDARKIPDHSGLSLVPENFDAFYRTLMGLRFPINVAEVLDLRYLINHAVDEFTEPPLTPDYRQFREALQTAIDSFSIDNKHHSERLLKILTMMRQVHYMHSVKTRDASERLRRAQVDNRRAHQQSIYFGLVFLVSAFLGLAGWFGLPEPGWLLKAAAVACIYLTWDFFRSLPILNREMKRLTQELNAVLRGQIRSIHWKALIHKLALVLGYKQITGIEVFRMDDDLVHGNRRDTRY